MITYREVAQDDIHATVKLIADACQTAQVDVATLFGASLMLVYIIGKQESTINYAEAAAFTKEMSEWVGLRLQTPQGLPS